MTAFPAARESDKIGHGTKESGVLGSPTVGPCGGPPVLIDGLNAAHVYDSAVCSKHSGHGGGHAPPAKAEITINGAAMVLIHGVPANRVSPSGDVTSCGAVLLPPGSPMVLIGGPGEDPASAKSLARTLMKAGGHGTLADCDLVAAEMGKLPPYMVQRFRDKGITVVACRGSVTDYRPDLKGKKPRGWPDGTKWDDVPGVGAGEMGPNECVIAVRGHGTPAGPHVPVAGEGHGSKNLVIHESFHSLDAMDGQQSAHNQAFNAARTKDASTLDVYESQAGAAGQQEAFSESAARYYGGDPGDAAAHPNLHSYWASEPFKPHP